MGCRAGNGWRLIRLYDEGRGAGGPLVALLAFCDMAAARCSRRGPGPCVDGGGGVVRASLPPVVVHV